ncbi:MAG: rod shape-determining protein MreC [Limisphaerales bacterium]
MLRKPHFVLLLVVTLAVLVLLGLPASSRSRMRLAVGGLFLPLFGLAGTAQAAGERAAAALTPRSVLESRIRDLEEDSRTLRVLLMEAEAATRENDRLRQMVGYPGRSRWRLKPARVIGRDPASWWQAVHLDIGAQDGVVTNLAVLAAEGLVGRVAEVSPRTCRVVLVGDPNCPVSAALADTRDTGVVRGASAGDYRGAVVDFSYLSRDAVVRPGQRVITSGQGGIFPAGITVGDVIDSRMVEAGIYVEARVRLAVNLAGIDHLWVKLP